MPVKILILAVLSIIAGLSFIAVGIYFLSNSFLQKLNDAVSQKSAEVFAKNKARAKGSAYTAIAFGALTLMWAAMLFMMPGSAPLLSVIYMVVLLVCCLILITLFK